ncbi:hypothetical protein EV424DRAFT_1345978 [Suillus variegatus]|nr:hypothetical protein EV424DRAFT_1345978 [Suillus variegatus]
MSMDAICFDGGQDGMKCNFVHFGSPQTSPALVAHANTCGCHLFDHIGNPNGAEGLELEDDPGQPLHDLGADESHIPASIECLSHSPSPQLHDVSSVVPVVEAHIEHPPDDLQAMKPTRAQTVPARNHTSPENGPCYHMQIPEVFTAQLAETSKCEEEQCQCHADEIKAQNHAWYHTVVYSWVKDSGQPNVFEFQSGTPSFTWPHLSLNHQVISLMGLAAARVNEGPDYLITVIEGQLVLLKNPNPRHTQDDAKMSASPSELEVKALLLSKGKGKAKPLLEALPHSRQPSLSYSAYSVPSFWTPSPPAKPSK